MKILGNLLMRENKYTFEVDPFFLIKNAIKEVISQAFPHILKEIDYPFKSQ